jgi:hypothetical protein
MGVVKFDNQVLNGINFRAGELSARQVKLFKVLAHIIESQYIDDLCKAQLKTFFNFMMAMTCERRMLTTNFIGAFPR